MHIGTQLLKVWQQLLDKTGICFQTTFNVMLFCMDVNILMTSLWKKESHEHKIGHCSGNRKITWKAS